MMKGLGYSLDVEVMDGRPGCGHGLEVVITRMCLDNLMSKNEMLLHLRRVNIEQGGAGQRIGTE